MGSMHGKANDEGIMHTKRSLVASQVIRFVKSNLYCTVNMNIYFFFHAMRKQRGTFPKNGYLAVTHGTPK